MAGGENLSFSPPADKRTLLRRVYYNLTGLPPTYEEVLEFERDASPDFDFAILYAWKIEILH